MQLNKEQVEHIAQLARLKLSPEELEKYRQELSSILDYVDKLQAVDTTDVEETSQVTGLVNVSRQDKVEDFEVSQDIISQAPEAENDYLVIPKIFENK